MKNIFTAVLLLCTYSVFAQWSILSTGTDEVIDFDGPTISGVIAGQYSGIGFTQAPSIGQLDSDAWKITGMSSGNMEFGGNRTSGDYARGTAVNAVDPSGLYSFRHSDGQWSFGVQPSNGDMTPGTVTLKMVNNSGFTVDQIALSYDAIVYNDKDRSTDISVSYSTTDIDNTFIDVPTLQYSSPLDAVTFPVTIWEPQTVTGLINQTLLNGETLFIKWTFADGAGNNGERDQIGIDEITINQRAAPVGSPVVGFTAPTATVNEGAGSYFAQIEMNENPAADVVVSVISMDGTALSASDYDPVNTTLTFVPGGALIQTVEIPGLEDGILESDETFELNLAIVSGDAIAGQSLQVVTIEDNDGSCPAPGAVIISEFMSTPDAVGGGNGEWVELYNTSPNDIDIGNWTIRDAGSDFHTIQTSTIIQPGEYIVLARNSDFSQNGGVTAVYEYSNFILREADDEIILECDGTIIDQVNYDLTDGVWPGTPIGQSISLCPTQLSDTGNDNGANWLLATSSYGDGDLGTPGEINDFCGDCPLIVTATTPVCDAITSNTDTYFVTFNFDGGATDTYTIGTSAGVVNLINNPTSEVSGSFTVTGINEGTDITVTIDGDMNDCMIVQEITSPICDPGCTPGSIVITEIHNNPKAVTDINGEWFEVYNTTSAPIDLLNWVIRDDDTDYWVIDASVIVPPGGFIVLGKSTNTGTNGGVVVDYAYDPNEFFLLNGRDEVVLECSGVEIDRVDYQIGATFPDNSGGSGNAGSSLSLNPNAYDSASNDMGSNWCLGVDAFGDGDLGSPGVSNPLCLPIYDDKNAVCETVGTLISTGSGIWQQIIYNGEIVAELNDMGHTLGTVTVDVYITGTPRENSIGTNYLDRTVYITSTSPVPAGQEVMIRLYFTEAEFQDLVVDATGDPDAPAVVADLEVTKVDATCGPTYAEPPVNPVIIPPVMFSYGMDHYAEFPVDGFSGFFLGGGALILPVELTRFTAEEEAGLVELTWITSSELNNSHFEVQRSVDGLNWTEIGTVQGAGTTNDRNVYSFLDSNPLRGNNFYRLRQVDFDGAAVFSDVRLIEIEELFKVLASNQEHILVSIPERGELDVRFYNVSGQLVFTEILGVSSGSISAQVPGNLGRGAYLVRFVLNDKVLSYKYIR